MYLRLTGSTIISIQDFTFIIIIIMYLILKANINKSFIKENT